MEIFKILLVIIVFCLSFFISSIIGVLLFCDFTGIKAKDVSDSDEWSRWGTAVTFAVLGVSIYITKTVYELLMAL